MSSKESIVDSVHDSSPQSLWSDNDRSHGRDSGRIRVSAAVWQLLCWSLHWVGWY